MKHYKIIIITAIILKIFISCSYSVEENEIAPPPDQCTPLISFAADIKPIIDGRCLECHNGNRFPDLRSFNNIASNAQIIKEQIVTRAMPLGSSLTTKQIATIVCWIDNGAPNN
ncbi:cytochrome c [Tenacibaculum maritimum]|uniref:cytochrome c n=1 Tax=Tenacibaculum maritimum TaxID=107401 RepID=UPI002307BF18|nr:cytochrome c [Tenacibaculum maritimum]MDB0600826.1 cytochrome c [Tenacibaculum maritimum]MDB0612051.1 cytochrome c [Tenacibaculum maritimum]